MAPEARVIMSEAEMHGRNPQDESQDSQLVTIYMHRLHGAGERSSSPVQPPGSDGIEYHIKQSLVGRGSRSRTSKPMAVPRGRSATVKNPAIVATVRAKGEVAPAHPANLNRPPLTARAADASNNRAVIASSQPTSGLSTPSHLQTTPAARLGLSKPGSGSEADGSLHGALKTLHRPAHLRCETYDDDEDNNGDGRQYEAAAAAAAAAREASSATAPSKKNYHMKMDQSQSPTQSNDGRSYEQYLPRGDDLIPSDGYELERLAASQRSVTTSANEGTTHDDDTGAVNFDFSALGRQDTQVSYPDPYDTDRLQETSPAAFLGLPETPAPPRNPFTDSKTSLMPASQMFRQTQTSSAYKTFSPTSSRPSPDNIQTLHSLPPHPLTSSPLKKVATITSPLLAQFPDVFGTSPQYEIGKLPFDGESQENEPPPPALGSDAGSGSNLGHKARRRRRRRQRSTEGERATERRLRPIPLQQPSTSDEIVPSTNRETMNDPAAGRLPDQFDENSTRDSQNAIEDTQVGAQDSQRDAPQLSGDVPKNKTSLERAIADVSSNEAVVPNTASSPEDSAAPVSVLLKPVSASDTPEVPENDFTHLQPRALGEMMPNSSEDVSKAGSFTNLLGSSLPNDEKERPRGRQVMSQASTGRDRGVVKSPLRSQIAETSPPMNSSSPPPALSTRARLRGAQIRSSTNAPTSSPRPASLTSSLSRLGATPTLSNKTTPATDDSPQRHLTSSSMGDFAMSPAVAKANRRKDTNADVKLKAGRSKNIRTQSLRSRRSLQNDDSTDELARSPSVSAPPVHHQSTRISRYSRNSLRATSESRVPSRGGLIFAGMAFAISFQSKQLGEKDAQYNSRLAGSSQTANRIKQGGGKVLTDGFDQLFEVTPVKNADRESASIASTPQPDEEINLTTSAQDTGFTALIADGHSRKVKYMQALALGLPCIHERWISTCVEKQKLVDWSDYLLCAGNSAFLGDAIRSRSLPSYDAATARLAETIKHRPRLLNQSRILLVMSRAEEQKKMAYVFLARVLGASLSRVYTVDEARKQLKEREDAGYPYDWVYIEEKMAGSSSIFSDSLSTSVSTSTSRKRKRRKEASPSGPPPKKIRTLSDELVIQSLILGRLIDENEMTV